MTSNNEPGMTEELVMLPASFAQELMYLVHRSAPDSTSYNVPRVRRLQGALNVAALQQALDALVERHEILRTTYALHDEHPVQVIHNARTVQLEQLDYTGKSEADVERVLRDRMSRPFDLGNDLLIRATLIRTAPNEYALLLESHHIAFDGWSRDILFRELDAFYRQFAKGETANLPALPIQYADFAIWQREQLSGDRLNALISHWRSALDGAPFTLDLPSDRERGGRPSFDSASVLFRLEPFTVDGAVALARANNATLYMVLLTAYMAVLQRWSGQSDVLVGSPVAGRARMETEGLIGYFANTIVQRGRFSTDPTFAELLASVKESSLSAFDHQEIPFERLVQELAGTQDAARSPIFQVVFTQMGVQSGQAPTLGDVAMQTFAVDLGVTKFDLTLLFSQRPEGVELTLRYRTDLFSQASAERFVAHVRAMVAGAVANPQAKVSSIDLLSDAERVELKKWNDTAVDEGTAATIVSMFEAQAARVPDRIAVVAGDALPTYAQLNASANQLAHALNAAGVQAGQPVGLLLDRSAAAITGLLGIMKAGGAYMPLSVDAPAARIADQLRESAARVVVTASAHAEKIPAGITVIALDADAAALAAHPSGNGAAIEPNEIAYVLFTSGSTGTPKGVAVTHANAVHYARAVSRVLADVQEGDGLKQLDGLHFGLMSTLAADLGNTSLLPSLLAGGTLHVLERATTTEPARFAEYIAANKLDILKTTPNHLSALLAGRQDNDLAAVLPAKWIVLGGEALRFDLARRLLGASGLRVMNHYGPTETTVGVLTNEVTLESIAAAKEKGAVTIPLGRPLANTRTYVVNAALQQQPVGIPGELLIGGMGVTQGYLGRADLTAERFVQFEGDRVYRTGDRVRRLDDGRIEFLGRTDDQVKIRGYRVELGEIERTLREHPGIEQCIVILNTDGGDQQLIAYVVPKQSGYAVSHSDRPTSENVSALAAARLPDYMVPGAIMFIAEIPLTANGKVDRNTLPKPDAAAQQASAYVAPRTETETKLAQIWKDVLKKEQIGATDNFLELGGHSLFAIRVLGKISKTFGVRLPLRTLFDAPTVEGLAGIIELEARLAALENMSEEDAAKLLASMNTTGNTGGAT